ncbi:hypothetical protein HPB50_020252 [Hyalomma asiaticum]|uniref:Uncharacterized protein n=1 Tax=Hyalomma asiaticum TaxID=266040 RepID=A0ACB7TD98_HYAAI|nr:hypothetical protein HPB50_020252 [Hyalomma asiaticum]
MELLYKKEIQEEANHQTSHQVKEKKKAKKRKRACKNNLKKSRPPAVKAGNSKEQKNQQLRKAVRTIIKNLF